MNNTKKTPGQICYEAYGIFQLPWDKCTVHKQWESAAAAVLASQWRPVTEPPEDETQMVICDKELVQFRFRYSTAKLWMPMPPLPQPPIDPYAELKAAHAAGKVIQWCDNGHWIDLSLGTDDPLLWFHPAKDYRIKPWTLSRHLPGFRALEPGEEWHRNDFTEEMLPEGWRPLLLGEQSAHGIDEAMWSHKPDEFTVQELSCITEEENYNLFWRTTRPLPPTTQELERKEFEEWAFNAGYGCSATITRDTIFIGWQAARATAKPNP